MGTLNHVLSHNRAKPANRSAATATTAARAWKYLGVAFMLVAAWFGLQMVGFLDPFSVLIRSFATAVNPVFNWLVRAAFYPLLALDWPWLTRLIEPTFSFLRTRLLSFEQPYFHMGLLIGLLFLAIALLNQLRRRFWCRYLCPLGALLGLLARFSFLRLKVNKETCTGCLRCVRNCEGACEPQSTRAGSAPSACLAGTVSRPAPRSRSASGSPCRAARTGRWNFRRRSLIASGAAAVGAVALLRMDPRKVSPATAQAAAVKDVRKFNPALIRPPGALDETEFLERCIKCGECMKVCTKNALHPTLMEAGIEGFWTPYLKMQLGYCEFNCTLCGQVCPTGAIRKLSMEQKAQGQDRAGVFRQEPLPPLFLEPQTALSARRSARPRRKRSGSRKWK